MFKYISKITGDNFTHTDTKFVNRERDALRNVHAVLEDWVRRGADRSKLVMGIPFYGQSFRLANPGQTGLKAPVSGPGDAGPITMQQGMISYMELCQRGIQLSFGIEVSF